MHKSFPELKSETCTLWSTVKLAPGAMVPIEGTPFAFQEPAMPEMPASPNCCSKESWFHPYCW